MSDPTEITGATVQLSCNDDDVWTVEQTQVDKDLSLPDDAVQFEWSFGPNSITGYVDTSTLDIRIDPIFNGIYAGAVTGSLKDGVSIRINLFTMKGSTKFYLRNGNELWIRLDQYITFNGSYQNDYKVLAF
ncbi:hypothetical protein DTO271G3_8275 [Paecilomyces variotii]|nr:hypothetical protein DTO271G3_8275 [Paecilomyces variotii]